MKVLLLGKAQTLMMDIALGRYKTTLDPGEEVDITISDAISSQFAPINIPLVIIGTNTIADWVVKQKRPDAVIVNSPNEAVEKLLENQTTYESELESEITERSRNPLLLTYSSKGGVGKTTSAISIGITLSNTGIKTVICDFDLAAPDIATYFKVEPKIGIESIHNDVKSLTIKVAENLWILPGPIGTEIPHITGGELVNLVRELQNEFQVIVGDTPPAPQEKIYLYDLFEMADIVYAIVDQSLFSVRETEMYAPMLLMMGVRPENIRIVVNRYSPKLARMRKIEQAFCAGFKKDVKTLPKVAAVIPKGWEEQVKAGYDGRVLHQEEWSKLVREVAGNDIQIENPTRTQSKKKGGLFGWLKRRKTQ